MNIDTAFGGPSVLRDYTVGNIHGVFYNPYNFGTFRTFCYLFTDRNKPCPNPPMQCGFCPYNIDDIRSTPRLTTAVTTPCNWRHTGASILHWVFESKDSLFALCGWSGFERWAVCSNHDGVYQWNSCAKCIGQTQQKFEPAGWRIGAFDTSWILACIGILENKRKSKQWWWRWRWSHVWYTTSR